MEIIIGMAIAFLIGAYIRKPFEFHFQKKQIVEIKEPETDDRKVPMEDQVANLMNFTAKRAKHEN